MRCEVCIAALILALTVPSACTAQTYGDGSSFTITPDYSHKEIYDVYAGLKEANQPQFITADLALHTGHLLFDYSLRAIEIEHLHELACRLTKAMVEQCQSPGLIDPAYAEAESDMLAVQSFFCVPMKILDPEFEIPKDMKERVEADIEFMKKHEGFKLSKVLDSVEDYSQYAPRGHYTRNEKFKQYFMAMMWYGRRMFRVAEARPEYMPITDPWSEKHMLAETRQMLMIVDMLYKATIDDKPAIETWKKLYTPTVLFAGRTEDLNPMEVVKLAEKVWGNGMNLGDEKKVREFAKLAAEFSKPRIDSAGGERKGFCFMAQRFTPDSYITQCLVTDADKPFGEGVPAHPLVYTGDRKPRPFTWGINQYMSPPERRFMPRGLDVMAVFGCEEALKILEADGDTEYEGYDEMLTFLRKDVGKMMDERKDENLYYAWLYALQPMMKPIESKNIPDCLKSEGWMRKQLAASLASWAELRHDTILYVKQSYTPALRGRPPKPKTIQGYVEPQPEVFNRIAAMVIKMHKDLSALGVMPEEMGDKYKAFAETCNELAAIAEKELAGQQLTEEDNEFIMHAAGRLKGMTRLSTKLLEKIASETDAKMALAADVHTDTNPPERCLEEAVGTPFLLTVTMPIDGKKTTLHGAVFSYYEFKQPIKDRLTDEAWQKMLDDADKRPALPQWYPVTKEKE